MAFLKPLIEAPRSEPSERNFFVPNNRAITATNMSSLANLAYDNYLQKLKIVRLYT